jgi:hypothetical protein
MPWKSIDCNNLISSALGKKRFSWDPSMLGVKEFLFHKMSAGWKLLKGLPYKLLHKYFRVWMRD